MDYLIITDRGYWGKAKSLNEAAKNANVNSRLCQAHVYRFDPEITENVGVTDMGSVRWDWPPMVMELPEATRKALQRTVKLGTFDVKLTKGNLTMTNVE